MRRLACAAILVSLFAPGAAFAGEFCDRLAAVEHAPFSPGPQSQRRFIEFHWVGGWPLDGFRIECRHSTEPIAAGFCKWLMTNTSMEFHDRLPRTILTCHGYRFPDLSYWEGWKARINLGGTLATNSVKLDIDLAEHKPLDAAVRLSVFPPGKDETLLPMPPLFRRADEAPDDD